MWKIYLKNFSIGLIFAGISAAIASVIIVLWSLLAKLLEIQFSAIVMYIVGGIVGVSCCFIFKRFFIEENGYFIQEELDSPKKNRFWVEKIKSGKFVKRLAAQLSYVPSFVLSAAVIVLAGVFYSALQSAGEVNYMGYTILCACMGAVAVSLITYGILGIVSIKACKKCGAANAFIYDEYLDLNEASGFTGPSYNVGGKSGGLNYWGGGYDRKKLTKFGSRVSRHCACCGEKSVYTESPENSKVVK